MGASVQHPQGKGDSTTSRKSIQKSSRHGAELGNWPPRTAPMASWLAAALVAFLGLAALAVPAQAVVIGTYPTTPKSWKVYGKAVQLGASLVTNFTDYRFNDKLLPQSSDSVKIAQKLPEDAVVVAAYLYWGGSALATGPDDTAQFTAADGFSSAVTADSCDVRSDAGGTGPHFLCRKDVTALVAGHPGPQAWNGTYSLGSVQAKVSAIKVKSVGDPPNFCPQKYNGTEESVCCQNEDVYCQGRHASWSLVMVYDTKFSDTTQRDVFLYDGFVMLDEKTTSTGQILFTVQDFLVADPPEAQLSFYAMEGDAHLGNPAQDPPGTADSPPCATCFDFVQFNGTKLTGGAGNNEANNIMNSTPEAGVDLDTFDVSNLVKTGDTTATFLVSSGNGLLSDNGDLQVQQAGAGELFFYNYTLLQINRKAPNFKNIISKTTVNATEAAPGETLTYTVDLLNNGQLDAENSLLKLAAWPPAGTEYVPGSTIVDGQPIPDANGQSALQVGLNLGNITNPAGGNSARKVTFKLKIAAAPGVSEVTTYPTVDYTYVGTKGSTVVYKDQFVGNTVAVKIAAAKLATPTLTVSSTNAKPGDKVSYTLTLQNVSTTPVLLSWSWDSPKEVLLINSLNCSLDVVLPTSTLKVDATGGANSTGLIAASNLQVSAGKTASCTWEVTVLAADALGAKGINPINGHQVLSQAQLTVDGKPVASDDPSQPGPSDATRLTLVALTSFVTSSKSVVDLSPDTPLLAGDQVQFTLTIVNSGLVAGTVTVTDPLPSQLAFVSSQSPELVLAGATVQATNLTVQANQTKLLIFTAQIKPEVAPGASFANVATLSPGDGGAPVIIQTPNQVVQGGPSFATSSKIVQDLNGGDLEPGDTVQYTLTFINSGKVASGPLQVVDPIDANLTDVSAITGGGNFDAGAKQISWNLQPIAAGGQALLTFQAKVGALVPSGTTIANKATLSGTELPQPTVVTSTVKVQAQPNLSLYSLSVISSAGTSFSPGDTATYSLNIQNTGTGAIQNGKLTMTLDGVLTGLVASGGGVVTGQTVVWTLPTLQKGQPPLALTLSGKLINSIAQGKQVLAQAQLSGEGLGQPALSDDPAQAGNSDPTVFSVTSAPNLLTSQKIYVDLNGGQVQGGDQVQFKITLNNSGNSPATGVLVSDVLAAPLGQVVVQGGSFDAASRTVTWSVPSVEPGKPVELLVTAVVDKTTPSGTQVTNQGQLAFAETPKAATTNTVSFAVVNLPDFGASTKAVSAPVLQAGGDVVWTLTIVNSGNQAGSNVVVSDALPKEVEQVTLSDGGQIDFAGKAIWTVPSLAPGGQKVLTVTAKLKKPLTKGTQICNQASVVSQENQVPSLTNPPGQTPVPGGKATCAEVDSAAKLSLIKDVFDVASGKQLNGATVKPKQVLRYVIRAKNLGNAVASDVVVSDAVPAGLVDVVALDGGTLDPQTKTISWPVVPTLGIGAADEWVGRFEAVVPAGADNGAALSNQAQVLFAGSASPVKSDDPTTPAVEDPTQVVVQSTVDFSKATLTVVDLNGGDARPGDALEYTLKLQNDGDGTGKDVTAVLPLDGKLENLQLDALGVLTPGMATWKLGTLAPGQGATLTIKATLKKPLPDGALTTLQGQIAASGFQVPVLTDADLTTPLREPTTIKVKAIADLSTSSWTVQDLNGGPFEPGDALLLKLTLRNTGDALGQLVPVLAALQAAEWADLKPFDGGVLSSAAGNSQVKWTVPLLSLTPAGDVVVTLQGALAAGLQDGQIVTVAAQLPGVAEPAVAKISVTAKARFDASVVTVEDETGWVAKVGQTASSHLLRAEVLVKNTGKAAAQNLLVTVPIPSKTGQLQIVTPGGVQQGSNLVWQVPNLAAGGQLLLTAKLTVIANAQDGDLLPFSAQFQGPGLDPATVSGPTLVVIQRPILKVVKAYEDVTGKHLFPGDQIRFSLTTSNVGNAAAQNLQVSDVVPVSIGQLVAEAGGQVQGQTASWTIASLQPGQSVTVTLLGKIAPGIPSGSVLVNQATAKADLGEPALSNPLQVVVTYPTLQVDLGFLPEAPAKLPLQPGDSATLQVLVQSQVDTATGVLVLASIDSNVFEVTAQKGSTWDPKTQTLRWAPEDNQVLQALVPGKPVVLIAGVKVKATASDGTNAAFKASGREGETGIVYDAVEKSVPIQAIPKLRVAKAVVLVGSGSEAKPSKVQPLDVVRYQLTVSVQGKTAAKDVVISDVLDPQMELVAVGNGGQASGDTVTWSGAGLPALATILPGQTVKVQLDARVKATASDGAVLSNQAKGLALGLEQSVLSDDPATAAVNDPTQLLVRVQSGLQSSLKAVVDDNGGALLAGETVTWRLTIVATSAEQLNGTKVLDGVPAGSDYVPGSTKLNGQPVADGAASSLPLVAGLLVNSPGQGSGVLLPGTDNAATVTFQTRVRADAADGSLLTNLATTIAEGSPPTLVGPVSIAVGKSASLKTTAKSVQILDGNANGLADVGEELRWTIEVVNSGAGAAESVTVGDSLASNLQFISGSLKVGGAATTDAVDLDAAGFDAKSRAISAKLGDLAAGSQGSVEFRTRIISSQGQGAANVASNQATVQGKGLAPELTDSDGDDSNGNQPTVVGIGDKAVLAQVFKNAQDENGGQVQTGDVLRFTIQIKNLGVKPLLDLTVTDPLPVGLQPVADSGAGAGDVLAQTGAVVSWGGTSANQPTLLTVRGLSVQPGETETVVLRARVGDKAQSGSALCNIATASVKTSADGSATQWVSKAACATVGAVAGEGVVRGTVFEDVGAQDGIYQPATDLVFSGFQVQLLPPQSDSPVIGALTTDKGLFQLAQVPEGERRIRVLNANGVVFHESLWQSPGAQGGQLDIALKPTGRTYDPRTGALVAGVRVFLVYDDADPIAPGQTVAPEVLLAGQQGQKTDATGAYLFSPAPGRAYRLDVAAAAAGRAFPSAIKAPEPGLALLDGDGMVVAQELPKLANGLPKYLTRFTRQGQVAPPPPRHNHLPVDKIASMIQVAVKLSRAQAQIGEMVGVTVRVVNGSTASIAPDLLTGAGGAELRQLLPPGLGLVPGTARLVLKRAAGQSSEVPLAPLQGNLLAVRRLSATSGQAIGLELPPGGELTFTALAAVGASAAIGAELNTFAQLYDTGGGALSDRASAALLVQADPLFDRAGVLVKVFCDSNMDGSQQLGEDGLPGARIYVDTGEYATSDANGRAHFVNLPGGTHLFKIDGDTVPPGSEMTGGGKRALLLTRGLTQTLVFPVRCALEAVGPGQVEVAMSEGVSPISQGPGVVLVEADARTGDIAVDGALLPIRRILARIAVGDDKPATLAASTTAVELDAGGELAVWTDSTGGFARYWLELHSVAEGPRRSELVYESQGSGDLPRKVSFVLPSNAKILGKLEIGRRYVLRIRAENAYGSRAVSAPMGLEVRKGGSGLPTKWKLPEGSGALALNGHAFALQREQALLKIIRPEDGRLLISLRRFDGSSRDEYMTLPKVAGKGAIPKPVLVKESVGTVKAAGAPVAVAVGPVTPVTPVAPAAPVAPAGPAAATAEPRPPAATAPPAVPAKVVVAEQAQPPAKAAPSAEPKAPVAIATAPPIPPPPLAEKSTDPQPEKRLEKPLAKPPEKVVAPAAAPVPAGPAVAVALAVSARGLQVGGREWVGRAGGAQLSVPAAAIPLAGGKALGQLMINASGVGDAREVALVLLSPQGDVLSRRGLGVPVPSSFLWAPEATGLVAGRYGVALEVLFSDGDGMAGYRTAPVALTLAASGMALLPAGAPDKYARATLFDAKGQPTDSTQEWLVKLVEPIKGERSRLAIVSVHDDGAGDGQGRSDLAAMAVDGLLQGLGAPRDRYLVTGVGAAVPDSKAGREALGPHRIELRWRAESTSSAQGSAERLAVPAGLWIDDRKVSTPALPSSVEGVPGQASRVVWQKAGGAAAMWRRPLTPVNPGAPAEQVAPAEMGRDVASFGSELLDGLASDVRAIESGKPRPAATSPELRPVVLAEGATDVALPAAADLQVWLPSAGKPLGSPEIAVRGRTRPGNIIHIQGQPVAVASDGRFFAQVPLVPGSNTLTVLSTDPRGNKATLQRNLQVQDKSLFLLAIADTSLSHVAAHLDEFERDGTRDWTTGVWQAGSLQVMGRGAVYLKGRIAGKYLGLNNLRMTAHLDTAKDPQLADFASNLLDPTRFYPVYGDGSQQVQDVQARGKLYVVVEADEGKAQLGNFRSAIQGLELLRYDRALYGARVEAKLANAPGAETKAAVFGAQQDRAVLRRTDVLRGTGGSLFYLAGRDVLEGSERVELVVRDRNSGLELTRLPQQRNNDYTIDYREGRLLFKSPVNSAIDGGLGSGGVGLPGGHLAWNGQPVFLEVVYEARGMAAADSAAFGGQVEQQLAGGKVRVGAAFVQEGRGDNDPTYRTVGAHAKLQIAQRSQATVEYAYSQSRDTLLSASDDGGLTFGTPKYPTQVGGNGQAVDGQAVKAQLEVSLSDFAGDATALPKGATPTESGRVKAWWQWVQPGFQSGGTIAQQGQQRFGLDSNFALSKQNVLTLRYDGMLAEGKPDLLGGPGMQGQWGSGGQAMAGSFSAWNRHTVLLQDTHKLSPRWTATSGASWGWSETYGSTGATQDGAHSVTVGGGAAWRATDRLTLRGDQQVIAAGDVGQLRGWGDHLISSVGADFKLDKALALTLNQRLGWGGQNSTAAGLRAMLDKDTSLYAQQRLEDTLQTGRLVSATVLGAEQRWGQDQNSRGFAEYQVDALGTGAMNRAVMGVGKRFQISEGLRLDAGYERQQVFSGPAGAMSRDALSLGGEWLKSDWWKLTSRQEVRLDAGDPSAGGLRKLQVLSLNNGQLALSRELTLFGRANYTRTHNQTADAIEAEALESTVAVAYRPITSNWLNVLGKATRLLEQRPANEASGAQLRSDKLILALEPSAELPMRLQLSQKWAWQSATERMTGSDVDATSDRWLWVTRLAWHTSDALDLAAEYRWLTTPLVSDTKHGALAEVAYLFAKAIRVGLGYNFSHITQTPAGSIETTTDEGGFYLRLIGLY